MPGLVLVLNLHTPLICIKWWTALALHHHTPLYTAHHHDHLNHQTRPSQSRNDAGDKRGLGRDPEWRSLVTVTTTNTGSVPPRPAIFIYCQSLELVFRVGVQSWCPNSLFLNKTINLDSEVNWSMQYLTGSYCYSTRVTSLYHVAVIYKNIYSVLCLIQTGGEFHFILFLPAATGDWHGYLPYTLHGARSPGFISRKIRVVHSHCIGRDP